VLPTNPLAVSLDEGSSSSADEIGNLERRRGHWGTSSSNVTHIYIKTAGRSLLRSSRVASAAGRLRPNEVIAQLILALGHFTGFATNEELTGILVELSSRCCGIARPNQLNQDK
jgi:hypothetical protein